MIKKNRLIIIFSPGTLFCTCRYSDVNEESGVLKINFINKKNRTLIPGISMEPVCFEVTGSGLDGADFIRSITGNSSVTITNFEFSAWNVTVTMMNSVSKEIGIGSGDAIVHTNNHRVLLIKSKVCPDTDIISIRGFSVLRV